MVTKKSKFKKTKNWFKVLSVSSMLVLGMSCSQDQDLEAEALESDKTSVLSAKVNTVFQAEAYNSQSGVKPSGGGWKVGYIQNGDWIKFDDFDHSGATSITVTAASKTSGGTIEFRKGSATGGDLLATVNVSGTGGWSNMQEFSANITGSSSNSDLYIVFKGGSGYLLDIDSFEFTSSSSNGGGTSGDTNLALEGNAEQSSTGWGGAPERAIDGDTNGKWSGGSVSHTLNESQPWWQVRLANDTTIGQIVIWNRTDSCCMTRLSNFDVFVYNQAGTQVYKTTITETPNPSVTINTGGVTGNRVRVKLKSTSQSLQLAEVQVFGEGGTDNGGTDNGGTDNGGTDNGGTDNGGGSTDHPTGSNPWDFFHNCNQWKITWIDGSEQKQLCSQDEVDKQYEVSSAQDALIFSVYLDGSPLGTTSDQTGYSRSELREREEDGGSDIYWTTDGDHALYIDQAVTHLPIEKDHIVLGQIHGNKADGIDDSMVCRLEGDHLFISFNGNKLRSDFTIKRGYVLGTRFEIIFRIIDGKHYCYYSEDGNLKSAYNSGNANQYLLEDGGSTVLLDLDYDQTYFKVGNYCQSNADTEGSSYGRSDNYCQVYVYGFDVNHKGESFR